MYIVFVDLPFHFRKEASKLMYHCIRWPYIVGVATVKSSWDSDHCRSGLSVRLFSDIILTNSEGTMIPGMRQEASLHSQ